tara:strand:- start:5831 stop:7513 length:1683 start_codon:yes stop_codon:yes gene_type:complete
MTIAEGAPDQALKAALKAHQEGDLEEATDKYFTALSQHESPPPAVYANLGAVLREQSKIGLAQAVYRRGLASHPEELSLLKNFANLQLQEGISSTALCLYLKAERIIVDKNLGPKKLENIRRLQAQALYDLGQFRLSLKILQPILDDNQTDTNLRLVVSELWLETDNPRKAKEVAAPILKSDFNPSLKQIYSFSNLLLRLGDFNRALASFEEGTSIHRRRIEELDEKTRLTYDTTCWNFSLMLLRRGILQRGWELFEHGRRVPNGRGGKQRTVFKVFPKSQVPEWDGTSLKDKRILVLGEQGIGDVMMFTMLIQPLLKEAKKVGFITYDRLVTLYERSFPDAVIYDAGNLKRPSISASDWDLQVPVGSIPMLRFGELEDYGELNPFLQVDEKETEKLKDKYNKGESEELIGFSWKGGGNAKQKRTKSLSLEDMLPLFRLKGKKWISLQYGNVNDELREFNKKHGLNIIIPEDIDPLKDMDRWSSLVKCCDRVISAANTTIHGAGCLGIPTTVILGVNPDWRWLGDHSDLCYWYKSVSIVRQTEIGDWTRAINQIEQELAQ